MNCVVSLVHILLAAVLHLSTVKTASITKGAEKSTNEVADEEFSSFSPVIPLIDVVTKSLCQPREVLVDIFSEYAEDTEHTYIPSCVVLNRCGGCCNDEALECVPTETHNVTMEVMCHRPMVKKGPILLSFTEHKSCICRQKPDLPVKKE
ncbi:vascular endothelial growth factor A-A isoform X1 [Notothenia coriiceps]|uniref:Vascular endothelial growth factor A-A isoform X1 n=1 Tax=Notothenia coriiceps TaxID=8208 RepID=A0A6I9NDY9_9TELE|nr:PREDICTED: vascular endothelial growth factor A-A-like isoform X1 [Notothenia coriiceps]